MKEMAEVRLIIGCYTNHKKNTKRLNTVTIQIIKSITESVSISRRFIAKL